MTKESDFTMPEGMKKGAELDYRFPEVFQESIPGEWPVDSVRLLYMM